jgi:hypothetical protein
MRSCIFATLGAEVVAVRRLQPLKSRSGLWGILSIYFPFL